MIHRGKKPPPFPDNSRKLPIDPEIYDRRATLTDREAQAIASIMDQRLPCLNQDRGIKLQNELARLLQPIQDVLSITKPINHRVWTSVQSLMLREMGRRQKAFWGWCQQDWVDTIAPNSDAFVENKSRGKDHRQHLIVIAYLFSGFTEFQLIGQVHHRALAYLIFGKNTIDAVISRVADVLRAWGYSEAKLSQRELPHALCEALLINRSPMLEDLDDKFLARLRQSDITANHKESLYYISRALAHLGIIKQSFPTRTVANRRVGDSGAFEGVPGEWLDWCLRWRQTTTIARTTATGYFYSLLAVGRWLTATHPEIVSPLQWTREIAVDFVAAVTRLISFQWAPTVAKSKAKQPIGKPSSDRTKHSRLCALRAFFRDCQEWGWLPTRFDPRRVLATPRSVKANIGPNPRVISDDIWAKLQWAGLNLTKSDLPVRIGETPLYPFEMVRAMAIVWLFCGLRRDEFKRLRCGCVRLVAEGLSLNDGDGEATPQKVCWLDVPTNKTGTAFTKPVDPLVGEAIQLWESVRPQQPATIDLKTGEVVHYLFCYRGHRIGSGYINEVLIPMLCRKAGVPEADARGAITGHRARATITSQLYNAREPMTVLDLKEWLGHRHLSSTEHYIKASPTKLAQAYGQAGYFERNRKMIDVLIDQEAIRNGLVSEGANWKYYDLGHGYCTYDFYDQCPHRMACARCDFYLPKESSKAQLLEGQSNLLRLKQEIPLTDEERSAVEDGIVMLEKHCAKLANIPTPAGPTPHEINNTTHRELPILRRT
jgi:Phage integrase family